MTEEQLNQLVALEFVSEYEQETGFPLRIKDCGRDFPDVVLERGGEEVWMELVSIPLGFLPQEMQDRRRFMQAVVDLLSSSEPEIQNYALQFQFISSPSERPIRLPKPNSTDWRKMLGEADDLLRGRLSPISTRRGMLLEHASRDFGVALPTLSRYFDAVLVNGRNAHGRSPGETFSHNSLDVVQAIKISLAKKRDKQYKAGILLLHTFPKEEVSAASVSLTAMGMRGPELVDLARHILSKPEHSATLVRFPEIWLFNRVICDGKRLFRIVSP